MSARRALVTGGSRGIGAAVAATLAREGYRVVVHCRSDVTAAKRVVADLSGTGHAVVSADIADPGSVEAMVSAAVSALGGLDVLINNAAIYDDHRIDETTYAEWQAAWARMIGVNLVGTANVTWCFVDHVRKRAEGPRGARIITVGSRGAYRGEPDAPAYGASKAGEHAFTQSLAVALARYGISVAGVAPGFVRTDLTRSLLEGPAGVAIRAQSPFNRAGEPEEVAAAVAWLASPAAEWASGTILDLNGASYLR
ncbi:SDR family NAD(P)-dependent oxidoreductase [Pendulispora albinea]|uniref:SDR family oxidoreductase n=1 Tax=Pendulispora albinea TaxID=2741071 RepID=A0ABZ2LR12_9BACT